MRAIVIAAPLLLVTGCSCDSLFPDHHDPWPINNGGAWDSGMPPDSPCGDIALEAPFAGHLQGTFDLAFEEGGGAAGQANLDFDLYLYSESSGYVRDWAVIAAPVEGRGVYWDVSLIDRGVAVVGWSGLMERDLFVDGLVGREGVYLQQVVLNVGPRESTEPTWAVGSGWLCPAGGVPAPALMVVQPRKVGPLSKPMLAANVPFQSRHGPVDIAAAIGGRPLAVAASYTCWGYSADPTCKSAIQLEPARSLPPNQDLELDVSAVRDVMGGAFDPGLVLPALKTTAVIGDLQFSEAPPPGAVDATCQVTFDAGNAVLEFSVDTSLENPDKGSEEVGLVALPEAGSATRVRVSFRLDEPQNPSRADFAVVRSDGAATRAEWRGTPELVVDLPSGSGPCWLTFNLHAFKHDAQSAAPPRQRIRIDAIAFE